MPNSSLPVTMRNEVKTLYALDRQRHVVVFGRDDGSFGFEDQWWRAEEAWFPVGRYSESFCDSAERAGAEARSRVQ